MVDFSFHSSWDSDSLGSSKLIARRGHAFLEARGHNPERCVTGKYHLNIGKYQSLKVRTQVEVVDRLSYNPEDQTLYYGGLPLSEKKLEKFCQGAFRLLFDPRVECSEAEWRLVLLLVSTFSIGKETELRSR